MRPGRFVVDGSVSSQYVSGLLFVLPTLPGDSSLRVTGDAVSAPYIRATEAVLRAHGIRFERRGRRWAIGGPQPYRGHRFDVPGDASSASYLWVAAALTGGCVRVSGIPPEWPQADRQILAILRRAGAKVGESRDSVRVEGPVSDGFDVDLTESPDLYPLVGVLAAGIRSTSRLRGAPHLVFKESDRRAATLRLVRGMGASVEAARDAVRIKGARTIRGLHLRDLDDHRVVMSAAVAGLVGSGPTVLGHAEAVAKSFPSFWKVLRHLGAGVRRAR
jgi:3-phosphoshikimate 1-carboxyvinyltransferase